MRLESGALVRERRFVLVHWAHELPHRRRPAGSSCARRRPALFTQRTW